MVCCCQKKNKELRDQFETDGGYLRGALIFTLCITGRKNNTIRFCALLCSEVRESSQLNVQCKVSSKCLRNSCIGNRWIECSERLESRIGHRCGQLLIRWSGRELRQIAGLQRGAWDGRVERDAALRAVAAERDVERPAERRVAHRRRELRSNSPKVPSIITVLRTIYCTPAVLSADVYSISECYFLVEKLFNCSNGSRTRDLLLLYSVCFIVWFVFMTSTVIYSSNVSLELTRNSLYCTVLYV